MGEGCRSVKGMRVGTVGTRAGKRMGSENWKKIGKFETLHNHANKITPRSGNYCD